MLWLFSTLPVGLNYKMGVAKTESEAAGAFYYLLGVQRSVVVRQ